MRVEKLELLGFKSFNDKTVFNLHPGITCIVGPNGCGKSNIVDAFKWVLGEQSAKSLRGDKMEQVIFTGSEARKPKGMAEVKLVVSGLGSTGNGEESAHLSVGRRLYRSGDSDYMINRNICRLRDIRDIFLDTGLEVKSYSILEQDRIVAVLSAKPEERRFILEEVAGVVKYKVRRNEAQSKLESSRNNLTRINDVVSEIRRQINSLDRQVKKAERYKRLTEELREIELRIARHDFAELQQALEGILGEYEIQKERDAGRRAQLGQAETEIETKRIALVDKEKALNELMQALQDKQREIAEHERTIAVIKTECGNLRENVGRLRHEEEETSQKIVAADKRTEEITGLLQNLDGEVESLQGRMQEQERSLNESEGEITRSEGMLEERRKEAFKVSDELGTLRNAHGRHTDAQETLKRKLEALGKESSELDAHLGQSRAELSDMEQKIASDENEIVSLKQKKEALDGEIRSLREQRDSLRTETANAREELASASSRLESLKEIVGSESAANELAAEVDIVASVSDIVEVPEEYEKAIESALREITSGLVLRGRDDILRAISTIKSKELGRTAFVSLGAEGDTGAAALPEGAIARASDIVKVGDEYRGMVSRLLGNVVVVRDIQSALSMRADGMTVVTLDGETVEPSGAVIAGKSSGILALKRQIRELEEDLERRKAAISGLEARVQETQNAIAQKESELEEAVRRTVEAEREISLLKLRCERQGEEIERTASKLEVVKMEREQGEREKQQLDAIIEEKAGELKRLEEDKGRVERTIAEIQDAIASSRAGHEQKRAASVDLRLEMNSINERINALRNESESVRGLKEELRRKGDSVRNEITLTGQRITEREAESEQKEEALKEEVIKARELEGRISAERDAISSESEGLRTKEQGLRALRNEIESIAHKLSDLEVQRTEHRMRMENLTEHMQEKYHVALAEVAEEPLAEDDHANRDDLRDKIEKLGPVSLGSIEEYEQLKERYDFLENQREDLERSIAELEEAIARINSTTRKKLREAYDALKVKFEEVFLALFGGGRAELVLTDERNILETGLDVVAQPPGKKLQNMTLLSGGEKTLTALALLFASFLIKPTPLCILDEADAALDDSNTFKFSQMIKELSGNIQFVVVTHNRVTMEAADYIYGITMEEPGVSKVISLELAEV